MNIFTFLSFDRNISGPMVAMSRALSLLSRPLLRLLLGYIGFVYPVMSMVVIGPSLPILRQRQWSLLYDVY
jgi:hypothetical protein